jgi:HNH endonuclease/NUMOD4 motif
VTEIWGPIKGYPLHMISSEGRVFSWYSERFLKPGINSVGYLRLNLAMGKSYLLHILVAETFIGPRPIGQVVRHKDGNRLNPKLANLEYGTYSENTRDSIKHGTHSGLSKIARAKAVATRDIRYPNWRTVAAFKVKGFDLCGM